MTILSRCQRFDLARVKQDVLTAHLQAIAGKEAVSAEEDALTLIASAGEGSVRDALSIFDQAIAHAAGSGVTVALVRDMLGLADKSQAFGLLEHVLAGEVQPALEQFRTLYEAGAEPLLLLQDMLTLTHFISRMKLVPTLAQNATYSEAERARAVRLAEKLTTGQLARVWQMLLKGLTEARSAPDALMATEMALIRLMHVADLPTPAEAIRAMEQGMSARSAPQPAMPAAESTGSGTPSHHSAISYSMAASVPASALQEPAPRPTLSLVEPEADYATLATFAAVVEEAFTRKEMVLYSNLKNHARLVSFAPLRIELAQSRELAPDFGTKLSRVLQDWTGERWAVNFSAETGAPSLAESEKKRKENALKEAGDAPAVASVLKHFPGARVVDIHS